MLMFALLPLLFGLAAATTVPFRHYALFLGPVGNEVVGLSRNSVMDQGKMAKAAAKGLMTV